MSQPFRYIFRETDREREVVDAIRAQSAEFLLAEDKRSHAREAIIVAALISLSRSFLHYA